MGVVQPLESPAAGDQHQAARRAGQQRADLRLVDGVVQHDQGPGAAQALPVEGGTLLGLLRDPLRGHVQSAQQPVQGLAGHARLEALGVAAQIDEQLPVGELLGQPVRGMDGQGGFADARHSVER
ncbi:MAG: hypothetical protein AUG49_20400 [Catenulispora sp. 13_1_20CM_3_70_7]|nr:MAG: hypothetical protein AUG49_20400 [Catenulispora sp. 13_1_20CM_3_70_7]